MLDFVEHRSNLRSTFSAPFFCSCACLQMVLVGLTFIPLHEPGFMVPQAWWPTVLALASGCMALAMSISAFVCCMDTSYTSAEVMVPLWACSASCVFFSSGLMVFALHAGFVFRGQGLRDNTVTYQKRSGAILYTAAISLVLILLCPLAVEVCSCLSHRHRLLEKEEDEDEGCPNEGHPTPQKVGARGSSDYSSDADGDSGTSVLASAKSSGSRSASSSPSRLSASSNRASSSSEERESAV